MASVETKTLTALEFFDWVHLPQNRGRRFELERGEVIEMPPAGKYHGFVCGNLSRIIGNFAVSRRRGYVCTNDAGVLVEENPDTVRGPDLTFYLDEQTAGNMERQYATAPPLLAVEVLSPNDRFNTTMRRVTQLLARGVKLVWIVDPEARDVSICREGQEPILVADGQKLIGGDLLPDFECRVSELFDMPGKDAAQS
jgi:Uma2 family endonuclease